MDSTRHSESDRFCLQSSSLESLLGENRILTVKLDILNQLVSENTIKYRNIQSENEKLEIRCKFNEKALLEYEQTLKAYNAKQSQQAIDDMKVSLQDLSSKNHTLLTENTESIKINKSMQMKIDKLTSENVDLKTKNIALEQNVTILQHQLSESENAINNLNLFIYDLKQKMELSANINNDGQDQHTAFNNLHSIKIQTINSNSRALHKFCVFTDRTTDDSPTDPVIAEYDSNIIHLQEIKERKPFRNLDSTDLYLGDDNKQLINDLQISVQRQSLNKLESNDIHPQRQSLTNLSTNELRVQRESLNKLNSNDIYIDYDEFHYVDYGDELTPIPANTKEAPDLDLLVEYFGDEKQAYNVWIDICDTDKTSLGTLAAYKRFYGIICKLFIEETECCRVPKSADLKAFVFKKNTENKTSIRCEEFLHFWSLFIECCAIVKDELRYLWDVTHNNLFMCNLFCSREQCGQILKTCAERTFIIRLASTVKGGVVLSYFEMDQMKHSLFIRKGPNKYEKSRKKTENGRSDLNSLSNIIRSMDKIQYLYTPNKIYLKKTVF